jgi:type IV secretion system protein VirB3
MDGLERDVIFTGLTRPQMLGGVAYSLVILNVVASTELFILFKALWVLAVAVGFHALSWAASLHEPRIFDIWRIRAVKCPRSSTWWFCWRCNSYRP